MFERVLKTPLVGCQRELVGRLLRQTCGCQSQWFRRGGDRSWRNLLEGGLVVAQSPIGRLAVGCGGWSEPSEMRLEMSPERLPNALGGGVSQEYRGRRYSPLLYVELSHGQRSG